MQPGHRPSDDWNTSEVFNPVRLESRGRDASPDHFTDDGMINEEDSNGLNQKRAKMTVILGTEVQERLAFLLKDQVKKPVSEAVVERVQKEVNDLVLRVAVQVNSILLSR